MFELIMQANATAAAAAPIVSAATTPDAWTGVIIAISTLVSGIGGLIVHYVNSPRIKAAGQLAKAGADKLIESKQDIATLAKVTYNMLPEEAAKIVDAQNVRLAELEAKVNAANSELSMLKANSPG